MLVSRAARVFRLGAVGVMLAQFPFVLASGAPAPAGAAVDVVVVDVVVVDVVVVAFAVLVVVVDVVVVAFAVLVMVVAFAVLVMVVVAFAVLVMVVVAFAVLVVAAALLAVCAAAALSARMLVPGRLCTVMPVLVLAGAALLVVLPPAALGMLVPLALRVTPRMLVPAALGMLVPLVSAAAASRGRVPLAIVAARAAVPVFMRPILIAAVAPMAAMLLMLLESAPGLVRAPPLPRLAPARA